MEEDPALHNKELWATQLAHISNADEVVGVIISSELGLNMVYTAAGIQEVLDKESNIIQFKSCEVIKVIRENNGNFNLKIKQQDQNFSIDINQVVNATGYYGKALDEEMGHALKWTVDIKGAGIIELNDKKFRHTPGVFFTEGSGMAQLSRFNDQMAGINYCTYEVEGTYVKGGVISFQENEPLNSNSKLIQLEKDFINKSPIDPILLQRTKVIINGCSRFIPSLKDNAIAVGFVPGSLGLIGANKNSRTSLEAYINDDGYHAINIAKGGGAVSAVMHLVKDIQEQSAKRYNNDVKHIFPQGSDSSIPEEFIIQPTENIKELAIKRAANLGLSENIGIAYHNK